MTPDPTALVTVPIQRAGVLPNNWYELAMVTPTKPLPGPRRNSAPVANIALRPPAARAAFSDPQNWYELAMLKGFRLVGTRSPPSPVSPVSQPSATVPPEGGPRSPVSPIAVPFPNPLLRESIAAVNLTPEQKIQVLTMQVF
eukprot:TRINITY_DN3044_c0_g1_i1.p3 TRINITY_DN3044_c0_g1~~TRINITY_DN3044_c0_g1_i1.p3  ORF type:complete len:159 (+),score=26.09 TRINITY_DN3044_c0_g1_i1:53-478(+)